MAFSKFDPQKDPGPDDAAGANPQAARRARILRYGWFITLAYTAMGFIFLAVFWIWGNPF